MKNDLQYRHVVNRSRSRRENPSAGKSFFINLNKKTLLLSGFVAACLAIAVNSEKLAGILRPLCTKMAICALGNQYLDVRFTPIDPADPKLDNIVGESFSRTMLARFTVSTVDDSNYNGSVIHLERPPLSNREIGNFPLQLAAGNTGYWSPAEGGVEYPIIGFPIIDFIMIKTGIDVNVTEVLFTIHDVREDVTPYVGIGTFADSPWTIQLVNESNHKVVDYILRASASKDEYFSCGTFLRPGPYGATSIMEYKGVVANQNLIDVRELILEAGTKDAIFANYTDLVFDIANKNNPSEFESIFMSFHNTDLHWELFLETYPKLAKSLPPTPAGYTQWLKESKPHQLDSHTTIFGDLLTKADEQTYHSKFCAEVPIVPPDGLGGGFIELQDAIMIRLEDSPTPYKIPYDLQYSLDEDNKYKRTAILFHSDKSAEFEMSFEIRNFNNTIYQSELLRLKIFRPYGTIAAMGCAVPFAYELRCENEEMPAATIGDGNLINSGVNATAQPIND